MTTQSIAAASCLRAASAAASIVVKTIDTEHALLAKSLSEVLMDSKLASQLLTKLQALALTTTALLLTSRESVNQILGDNGGHGFSEAVFTALRAVIRRLRLVCELPPCQARRAPIVFTAPHTLELQRDGCVTHAREDYTGTIALRLADLIGGAYIGWATQERDRVKALINNTGAPDASNRDPNYLRDDEQRDSPWFNALRSAREQLGAAVLREEGRTVVGYLHVDVHGTRDPPVWEVDCMLGTGAMGDGECTRAFRSRLESELRPLLQSIETAGGGRMDLHAGGELTPAPFFSGCRCGARNTLTQTSTNCALWQSVGSMPFSLAVQVELSLRLRKYLVASPAHLKRFALGIVHALQGDQRQRIRSSTSSQRPRVASQRNLRTSTDQRNPDPAKRAYNSMGVR